MKKTLLIIGVYVFSLTTEIYCQDTMYGYLDSTSYIQNNHQYKSGEELDSTIKSKIDENDLSNEGKNETSLENLSNLIWKFSYSWLLLSIFSALIIFALYDALLRKRINYLVVRNWLARNIRANEFKSNKSLSQIIEEIEKSINSKKLDNSIFNIYDLHYTKLCNRISQSFKNSFDIIRNEGSQMEGDSELVSALTNNSNKINSEITSKRIYSEEESYHLFEEAEKNIDMLQLTLKRKWKKYNYITSFLVSFLIVLVIELATWPIDISPNEYFLYAILILSITVMSPILINALEDRIN
jgi:hypothetical protein